MKMMTRNSWTTLAAAGSLALVLGAFGFQYIGGLAPCQLCLWQRWPHAAAVLIGVLALWLGNKIWPLLGAAAALTTAGIGLFHVGVEQKWWDGLASCTVDTLTGLSGADLLNTAITVGAPTSCGAVAWQMMGISMAGWNAILSLGLAVMWLLAARRAR